jgi:hypothetical protein
MKLLRKSDLAALVKNRGKSDAWPAVKFFDPCGASTWLFSELGEDGDSLFGLCDLGMGCPELGYASLAELSSYRGRFGLGIERDMHWKAARSLSEYADEARSVGRVLS